MNIKETMDSIKLQLDYHPKFDHRLIEKSIIIYRDSILNLITEEIELAHLEGDKTSRLTSLFNKIQTK